nr:reverse transcriptase domain-containing protein [Tanacetum cinerariifolium]
SPEYVPESYFEVHPEDDDDEDPKEDPVDYLADGGDDSDDEEESSEDDKDDEMDIEADEEEEEEEHPAPADSVVVVSTAADQAPSTEETEPFKTDESAATPPPHPAYRMTARISIPAPVPMPSWTDSEVVRLLAISSPPASPLSPWSSPPPQIPFPPLPPILSPPSPVLSPAPPPSPIRSLGYRAAMIRLRDEAASTSSLPLYEVGKSSSATAARPAGGLRADYGFVAIMDREIMRDPERKVGYGITDSCDEIVETLQGAPMSEIRELQAADRRRQTVISELLRIDHRRSTKISMLRIALQGQVTALQEQVTALQAQKQMAPRRTTRSTAYQETINATSVTNAQLPAMIDQGVTDALRSTNGDDSHNSRTGVRRIERATRECTYTDFLKCQPLPFKGTEGVASLSQWCEKMEFVFHINNCAAENQVKFATCTLHSIALTWWNTHVQTVGHEAAYGMTWKTLMKMMTKKYCPRNEIRKLEMELWDLKIEKYVGGLPDMIHGSVVASKPKTMQEAIEIATELMDKKIRTFAERETASKRKFENTSRNTQNQQQHSNKRRECPKLKNNNNHGNQGGRNNAPAIVHAVDRAGADPDANVVTGTFLLNNRYASVLFVTGADRSFVSTTFSTQINITPSTLDHCYDVELSDGRIIGLNTILRGCALNLLNHPFNIDLMPVEVGSFDAIIGMDWLAKYQAVIVCAEKIVCIPWGNETLIIHGDSSNQGNVTRLSIISCTKTKKYVKKGFPIFLAHITTKEVEDKSEKKRLEDVPIAQNFPELFPEDLPGLPPTRPMEFQIDLVPGAAPELATLCPTMVSDYEKMIEAFIEGLPRSIKRNVTASKPQTLEEAINIAQRLMDQVTKHTPVNCRNKGPATGSDLLPVTVTCHACGEKGHYTNQCQKTTNNNAQGRAYMLRDMNAHRDLNVVI